MKRPRVSYFALLLLTGSEKAAAKAAEADKDGNDLDAVAGNAEDDIADLIKEVKEKELLYSDKGLLGVYGPLIVGICASPKRYKVSFCKQPKLMSSRRHCVKRPH